jgi:hypothetical protein
MTMVATKMMMMMGTPTPTTAPPTAASDAKWLHDAGYRLK